MQSLYSLFNNILTENIREKINACVENAFKINYSKRHEKNLTC